MTAKPLGKLILTLSLALAACAPMQLPTATPEPTVAPIDSALPSTEPTQANEPNAASTPEPTATGAGSDLNLPDYLSIVTPEPAENAVVAPLPGELQGNLEADLAQRLGGDTARLSVQLRRAEAVTWNDGSLGCPQPGVFYTQATIDGFWVVYEAGGAMFDYRVDQRGRFFLCENAAGPTLFDRTQPTAVIIVP